MEEMITVIEEATPAVIEEATPEVIEESAPSVIAEAGAIGGILAVGALAIIGGVTVGKRVAKKAKVGIEKLKEKIQTKKMERDFKKADKKLTENKEHSTEKE